ncbi:MAG: tetratricopeptide repeat protein, partial [Vicinamibacterales bacterium]|nr:tetratricopeptide repeat protein [Vicinamibacterales bacterium]
AATNLGRALMGEATRLEGAAAAVAFDSAATALGRAESLNPQDPYPPRNLASLARVRARTMRPDARGVALAEADHHYRRATALAPRLPGLWVEWANVDAERRRFADARQKLARAADLDSTRYDVWLLQGLVNTLDGKPTDGVTGYGRALTAKPGDVAALRGRAVALAQLGRQDEARADAEAVLRQSPTDAVALRLRADLGR